MENIFVESDKQYDQGFLITEQELRRLVDVINDQLKKIEQELEPELDYVIKFKNGVIAKTENLEEIFSLENGGLGEITKLAVNGTIVEKGKEHEITVEFRKYKDSKSYFGSPVEHSIKGKSRDWVFVTSSQIEERIRKLKPPSVKILPSNKFDEFILLLPVLLIATLFLVFYNRYFNKAPDYVEGIETKWKANEISDPIEVLIAFEKNKNSIQIEPFKYFLGGIFALILLYFLLKLFAKKILSATEFLLGRLLK